MRTRSNEDSDVRQMRQSTSVKENLVQGENVLTSVIVMREGRFVGQTLASW